MSDGLPAFARICVNRLSQTTEARIGRVLKKIFLLCCFSFSKKEKSDSFIGANAPEVSPKATKGREVCLRHEQSLRQLAMLVATSLYTKEA